MKQHPILFSTPMIQAILAGKKTQTRRIIKPKYLERGSTPFHTIKKCQYGLPGDQLWIRETFVWEGEIKYTDISPIGSFYYKADFPDGDGPTKWKPSIFMPREACRIILAITKVRVIACRVAAVTTGLKWFHHLIRRTIGAETSAVLCPVTFP